VIRYTPDPDRRVKRPRVRSGLPDLTPFQKFGVRFSSTERITDPLYTPIGPPDLAN
jgi:hypothetical protein